MRIDWIDEQLKQRGLPRRRLVEAIPGMTETKMLLVMSGYRRLSAEEADNIRRFFGYALPDDPVDSPRAKILDQIAMLHESQIHAVALYLEALSGDAPEPRQVV